MCASAASAQPSRETWIVLCCPSELGGPARFDIVGTHVNYPFRRHPFRWALGLLLAVAVLLFSVEELALRLRLPPWRDPIGQIQVHRLYVLKKARNKVDILPAEWEPQDCVRALSPHLGLTPCWWLARHTEQQIEME